MLLINNYYCYYSSLLLFIVLKGRMYPIGLVRVLTYLSDTAVIESKIKVINHEPLLFVCYAITLVSCSSNLDNP
jgi:hypothetical protein